MADEPGRAPRRPRRLPALLRHVIVVTFGVLVAVLSSYLLRKIGF